MKAVTRLSPVTLLPVLTFLVSAWVAAGLFYRELPNLLPTHWSALGKPDGFTAKPWGVFVLPLTMTLLWVGRRLVRHLSFPSQRRERFPGAFDFRMMLSIGLLFVIWTVVIAQSVFWLRAVAIPASIALVVSGRFLSELPFSAVSGLGSSAFLTHEADWTATRPLTRISFPLRDRIAVLGARSAPGETGDQPRAPRGYQEAEPLGWLRARGFASAIFVIAGLGILALVAFGA